MVENKFGVKFASYKIKWKVFNKIEIRELIKHNNMRVLGKI